MTTKTAPLIVGLAAPGLFWFAARGLAGPEGPPAEPPPAATVLLLSNGRLLHGAIREEGADYVLQQKAGVIRFPKTTVERAFGSVLEVYQYKRDRLAQDDPDEHMKLAQWCLSQGLNAEATDQLRAVVALIPGHDRARAMLQNLALTARRAAPSDPAVSRTAATTADRPQELSSDVLAQIRRDQAHVRPVTPVIFDLPPALAVRRFQEFAWSVHPALQTHCARCHNERSDRQFQLVEAKNRRDLANHLLVTTNLDATLRLIDPANPTKSELLVSAVLPHGPSGRPILSGPNDPSYQRLAAWINNLKGPQKPAETATTAPPASSPAPAGFASDRSPAPPQEPGSLALPTAPVPPTPRAAGEPAHVSASNPAVPPDAAFPTSPLLGGTNPAPVPAGAAVPAPGAQTITLPSGEVVPVDTRALSPKDPPEVPGAPRKKPIKLDPTLLEKILSGKAR
jgi:hypothetical protein